MDIYEIDEALLIHETESAVFIEFEGNKIWIPISQIQERRDNITSKGHFIDLEIPEWLAIEKDMI